MIIKDKFTVTIGQHVINEFVYELERSEEKKTNVTLRHHTTSGGRDAVTKMFETDKTDEEIIEFFKRKHALYKEEISRKWFFLKSIPIVKFSKELEIFLSVK